MIRNHQGKVLKNKGVKEFLRVFPSVKGDFFRFSSFCISPERAIERNYPTFLWFNGTLTYCKLHNFSGTFVFHVRCRLFLWKILKCEVCNSLGSYLYILLKIHQTSYFNSDSITDRSNIIKKPQY